MIPALCATLAVGCLESGGKGPADTGSDAGGTADDADTGTSGEDTAADDDPELVDCGGGVFVVEGVDCPDEESEEPEEAPCTVDGEPDSDCDGLSDADEAVYGTRPDVVDTDGDGLPDGVEVVLGYDPRHARSQNPTVTDLEYLLSSLSRGSDVDGDGLSDALEEMLGYDPLDPNSQDTSMTDLAYLLANLEDLEDPLSTDSDGDGLTDALELFLGSLADDADSDGDGLNDAEELHAGTDWDAPESDGDGLTDGEEESGVLADGTVVGATDPTDADSDDDGYMDGVERSLGSDPRDDESMPSVGRTGAAVGCDASEVYGATFSPHENSEDNPYYSDWNSLLSEGTECTCSVTIATSASVYLAGISVFSPTANHKVTGSWWAGGLAADELDVAPRGVVVDAILDAGISESGFSDEDLNLAYLPGGRWQAFGLDSVDSDGLWTRETVAGDVGGTYSLTVSHNSLGDDSLDSCHELDHVSDAEPGLQLRLDVAPTPMLPPAYVSPEDAAACSPGAPGSSTGVQLAQSPAGSLVPLPVMGSRALAGAAVQQIEVRDWRGAEWVSVKGPAGEHVRLTPEVPGIELPGAGWRIDAVRFDAGRATEGVWAPPALTLDHHCVAPSTERMESHVRSYDLSRSAVDTLLDAASPVGLKMLLPQLQPTETAPLRARLITPTPLEGQGPPNHRLRIDLAGVGRVATVPLVPRDGGGWSFRAGPGESAYTGTITEVGSMLYVRLDARGSTGQEPGAPIVTLTLPASR